MQSKTHSAIEAWVNSVVGIVISWLFTFYALPLFGVRFNVTQATWVTGCYFVMSTTRAYILRRIFNSKVNPSKRKVKYNVGNNSI